MFRNRRRKSRHADAELNITAFMNLMVVLVPFLLLTAVFSQVSVLQLNLPGGDGVVEENPEELPPMQLEVILRSDRIVLSDRNTGIISEFKEKTDESGERTFPYIKLNEKLQQIKARAAEITSITVLAETDTTYDVIVQTMDAVRLIPASDESDGIPGELFPDIGIGSAPPDQRKEGSK
ncbi:MAG TPA: biopolymer transporter ExbD [Aeromonadales bacterium]|nr:biopolymer transporter ExbD [Aeromonadales bacterium]